jgi:superfamily II RNA helicase
MNFHYDFIFKILNGGRTAAELIEGSYWWALEKAEKVRLDKEIAELEKKSADAWTHLTTEQRAACEYRKAIDDRIASSQNSKRKAALRELVAWKDEYRESIWNPLLDRYNSAKLIENELNDLRKRCTEVVAAEAVPSIRSRIRLLEECGYVEEEPLALTKTGLLASEINEGHPFLMTELFLRMRSGEGRKGKELLTVLATFLGEREDSEGNKSLSDLTVSLAVREELWRVGNDAQKFLAIEKRLGIDDIDYWTLSTEWIEPISRWLEGEETVASLAAHFGLFEGNIQKALMKLSGLVEEFQALASLSGEVDWLKELEDSRQLILRDTVIAESLYLRI